MNHHGYSRPDARQSARRRRYTAALTVLGLLFAVRVAAQFLQLVAAVPWLPPSADFQGSGLPYPVLFGAQLAILLAMAMSIFNLASASGSRSTRKARQVRMIGIAYAFGTVLRVVVGIMQPAAGAWFQAWISSAFHLLLAAFLIVFAAFTLRASRASTAQVYV